MHRFVGNIIWVLLAIWGISGGTQVQGQVTVRGTIYNMYRTRPLTAVSVVSTSGKGTITDSNGNYMIIVNDDDSLYFSYLGRSTMRFPIRTINVFNNFDVALHVDPTELKEVRVAPPNYRRDSLQNRKDYAKIFDFRKPGLSVTSPGTSGLGVGLDLDELINVFRFNRNRRILAFQRRLVEEEQEKFVDHRFSRAVVKKITHISNEDLETFMTRYRPSLEFCKLATEYEFLDYIKLAYRQFKIQGATTAPKPQAPPPSPLPPQVKQYPVPDIP